MYVHTNFDGKRKILKLQGPPIVKSIHSNLVHYKMLHDLLKTAFKDREWHHLILLRFCECAFYKCSHTCLVDIGFD